MTIKEQNGIPLRRNKMDEKVKDLMVSDAYVQDIVKENIRLLSLLSEKEKDIKELKRNRFLCEVCWQTLEPDGSCYTCRLERRVKELEEILKSIKADPSVGKLVVEGEWPESPDY